jgi:hypothetical protein
MPLYIAAMHFYLTPPTGSTFPLRVISPVIARDSLGAAFKIREAKQVRTVIPAEGPSFFVEPSGTCRWMDLYYKVLHAWKRPIS